MWLIHLEPIFLHYYILSPIVMSLKDSSYTVIEIFRYCVQVTYNPVYQFITYDGAE